jgi:hypothetical protein
MTTVREFANSSAASGSCNTGGLRSLNNQILSLLLEALPGALVSCEDIVTVSGASTIALLQPAAKEALRLATVEKGQKPKLVHAYRTVAQQFVLRQWFLKGKCGITSARNPGHSDHEKGTAIDIKNNEQWRTVLSHHDWVWAGPGDPGHFRYTGGSVNSRVLKESIRAFQRLWNKHHPGDLIDDDGVFGDVETGPRLLLSPIEGF